jgi:hypothetical protein
MTRRKARKPREWWLYLTFGQETRAFDSIQEGVQEIGIPETEFIKVREILPKRKK